MAWPEGTCRPGAWGHRVLDLWMRVTQKRRGQKSIPLSLGTHIVLESCEFCHPASLRPACTCVVVHLGFWLVCVFTQHVVGASFRPFCQFLSFVGISIRFHLLT